MWTVSYSVCRVVKYTSRGNVITMTRRTSDECSHGSNSLGSLNNAQVLAIYKYTNRGNAVKLDQCRVFNVLYTRSPWCRYLWILSTHLASCRPYNLGTFVDACFTLRTAKRASMPATSTLRLLDFGRRHFKRKARSESSTATAIADWRTERNKYKRPALDTS